MDTGRWDWLGEHLAVDLANTVRRRGRVMTELLTEPADLAGWLAGERDRLVAPERVDADLLEEFVVLRDHALRLLRAADDRQQLPADAVAAVNQIALQAPLPRLLNARAGRSVTSRPDTGSQRMDLLATLAAAVVDLLSDPELYHLGFCDAPSCGQYFHRRRPNQAWCCPRCGDRARSARHHQRAGPQSPAARARDRAAGADGRERC